jgi:hypothetical protein
VYQWNIGQERRSIVEEGVSNGSSWLAAYEVKIKEDEITALNLLGLYILPLHLYKFHHETCINCNPGGITIQTITFFNLKL